MKVFSVSQTASFAALASDVNGPALNVEHLEGVSFILQTTDAGALAGSFKLQISNDAFIGNVGTSSNANPNATWLDYAGSAQAVAGAEVKGWNVTDLYFKAIRLVWTASAGAGSAKVDVQAKGVS